MTIVATCCNMLQHVATCCNMLQHIATCCNILQHVATYCGALPHFALLDVTSHEVGATFAYWATTSAQPTLGGAIGATSVAWCDFRRILYRMPIDDLFGQADRLADPLGYMSTTGALNLTIYLIWWFYVWQTINIQQIKVCNMLQHLFDICSTFCNISQHVATFCNLLQYFATCCNML